MKLKLFPNQSLHFSKPKANNKTRKSSKVGKGLKNTRNQKCTSRKSAVCCPHMAPDDKGLYAATNEMTPLKYRGKKYELHTCCKMCGTSMNKLAKTNPDKFKKIYRGNLIWYIATLKIYFP